MATQATRPASSPAQPADTDRVAVGQHLPAARRISATIDRLISHWLLIANLVLGIFVITPWLAPVFMHVGFFVFPLIERAAADAITRSDRSQERQNRA